MNEENLEILRVSADTPVSKLSGSIIKTIEEGKDVELHACGASSCNQAVKAAAKARGVMAGKARDLYLAPGFAEKIIDGELKTILVLRLILK